MYNKTGVINDPHSARPIVMPVANIVFCCFVFLDLDGRTTMIPTSRDFGLAEWINKAQPITLFFQHNNRTDTHPT